MPEPMKVAIAIIGAGSGGLSVAAGAAQLGAHVKRVAGAWYTPKLFSNRTRKVVKWMQRLP